MSIGLIAEHTDNDGANGEPDNARANRLTDTVVALFGAMPVAPVSRLGHRHGRKHNSRCRNGKNKRAREFLHSDLLCAGRP